MSLPSVDDILILAPEDLAPYILKDFACAPDLKKQYASYCNTFITGNIGQYPQVNFQNKARIGRNIAESLTYLQSRGFLAFDPEQDNGWLFLTRNGAEAEKSLEAFRQMDLRSRFSPTIFHTKLRTSTYDAFVNGNFQQAVSDATMIIEDYVRTKSQCAGDGVQLMRAAFNQDTGPLRSQSPHDAERLALAHLFAGASGYFRNPAHHRLLAMNDPGPAVEQLMFASLLLREVDEATISP